MRYLCIAIIVAVTCDIAHCLRVNQERLDLPSNGELGILRQRGRRLETERALANEGGRGGGGGEGRPSVGDGFIIAGEDTTVNEFPWQAAIIRYGEFICGGSLIHNMFILTAAHCVQGFEDVPDFFTVRLGSSAYETSTVSLVERIIVHPRYSSATFQNDVALLQLMAPVTYTDSIKPAVLAPITINTGKRAEAAEYAGMEATVSGWGRTDVKATADVLQKIDLTMLSNDDCRDYYSRNSIKSSMLCAGRLTDDVYSGPCYGDSGGPMVTSLSGLPVQVGIVSWGEGCLRPYPSVFTRVSSFREWISAAIVDALVAG